MISSESASRMRSPFVGPYFFAYAFRECLPLMGRCPPAGSGLIGRCRDARLLGQLPVVGRLVAVPLFDAAPQAGLAGVGVVEPAAHQGVEPVDDPPAPVRDQPDLLAVAGLEPNRVAARQV